MPSYHSSNNNIEQSILPEFDTHHAREPRKTPKSPARRLFALSERFTGAYPHSASSASGKFRDKDKYAIGPPVPPVPDHHNFPQQLQAPPVPPLPPMFESFTSPRRLQERDRGRSGDSSQAGGFDKSHGQKSSGSSGSASFGHAVEIVKTPNEARKGMRTGVPSWGHGHSHSSSSGTTSAATIRPRSEKPSPRTPSTGSPDSFHLVTPPSSRTQVDGRPIPPRSASTTRNFKPLPLPSTQQQQQQHGPRHKSLMPQLSLPNLGGSFTQFLDFPPELGDKLFSPADRKTLKPPPKGPVPTEPFRAIMRDIALPASGEIDDKTFLVNLSFAFSLAEKPDTSQVTLPLWALRPYEGRLVSFIDAEIVAQKRTLARMPNTDNHNNGGSGGSERTLRHTDRRRASTASTASDYSTDRQTLMEEIVKPEMTDGESAEDSEQDDYDGLSSLLKDEYLRSLWVDTPMKPDFLDKPPPMPITHNFVTPPKHKARTRNQFVQQGIPARPALSASASSPALLDKAAAQAARATPHSTSGDAGGQIKILLMRDAVPYHLIANRLLRGSFPRMEGKRRRVEDELRWLGMNGLAAEVTRRSLVLKGGEGYI